MFLGDVLIKLLNPTESPFFSHCMNKYINVWQCWEDSKNIFPPCLWWCFFLKSSLPLFVISTYLTSVKFLKFTSKFTLHIKKSFSIVFWQWRKHLDFLMSRWLSSVFYFSWGYENLLITYSGFQGESRTGFPSLLEIDWELGKILVVLILVIG